VIQWPVVIFFYIGVKSEINPESIEGFEIKP
jgi:hypothetical protein